MTADERIERLLSRFGQTISDLPKAQTEDYAYSKKDIGKAYGIATEWHGRYNSGSLDTGDYICHLADIIDRMEIALETATRLTSCGTCANEFLEECKSEEHCNYRVCDWCLRDEVTKEEVDALDEDR